MRCCLAWHWTISQKQDSAPGRQEYGVFLNDECPAFRINECRLLIRLDSSFGG